MGNKHGCCVYPGGRHSRTANQKVKKILLFAVSETYFLTFQGNGSTNHHDYHQRDEKSLEEGGTNLQHISEREPDDLDQDPSLHPTAGPLFLIKSSQVTTSKILKYMMKQDYTRIYFLIDGVSSKKHSKHHHHHNVRKQLITILLLVICLFFSSVRA